MWRCHECTYVLLRDFTCFHVLYVFSWMFKYAILRFSLPSPEISYFHVAFWVFRRDILHVISHVILRLCVNWRVLRVGLPILRKSSILCQLFLNRNVFNRHETPIKTHKLQDERAQRLLTCLRPIESTLHATSSPNVPTTMNTLLNIVL